MRQVGLTVLVLLLFGIWAPLGRGQEEDPGLTAARKADRLLAQGKLTAAAETYQRAVTLGFRHPDLFRNLSLVLYDLRLVADAVAAMEHVVALQPDVDLFHMELGALYLGRGRLMAAEKALQTALRLNPGLSQGYFYLAELRYQQNRYGDSWQAVLIAQKLGRPVGLLTRKLLPQAPPPEEKPWEKIDSRIALRQMVFRERQEAEKVLARLAEGELFEEVADNESLGPANGGYAGLFRATELLPAVASGLRDAKPYDPPVIVDNGDEVLIVQRLLPFPFGDRQSPVAAGSEVHSGGQEAQPMAGSPAAPQSESGPQAANESPAGRPDTATLKAGILLSPSNRKKALTYAALPPEVRDDLFHKSIDSTKVRVYAGSFYRTSRPAIARIYQLRQLGFGAFGLIAASKSGVPVYNIVAGQYDSRKEAQEAVVRLAKKNIAAFVSARRGPVKGGEK